MRKVSCMSSLGTTPSKTERFRFGFRVGQNLGKKVLSTLFKLSLRSASSARMPPLSDLSDDLSDDDDDVTLPPTKPTAASASAKAKPPPVPKPQMEVPAGIPPDLALLFSFDKPRASGNPDAVKAHIAKVLGKRRAIVIAATVRDGGDGGAEGDEKDAGGASGSEDVPLTKSIQKLVDDEREDEKRRRKMRVATADAKQIKSDEKRAMAAIAEAMAEKQTAAETMKDEVREKAEAVAREIGNTDADDTPYPSAFIMALDDHAFEHTFGSAALDRFAPELPTPTPKTLHPFVDAAKTRVTLLKGSEEDAASAVKEALREAAEGGFLAAAFAAVVDANAAAKRRRGTGTGVESGKAEKAESSPAPPCDAATARWLFEAATRPESSHGVALGARDALLASAGYEPMGVDTRARPRRRRGVFPLPVVGETDAGDESDEGGDEIPEENITRAVSDAPPLAWVPTAREILEALRHLGVRAPYVGKDTVDAGDTGKGGKGKGAPKSKKLIATTQGKEQRKHISVNAPASDMSLNQRISRQDSEAGSFALSGRSATDKVDASALMRPPPGPLKPQVFAAVQLLTMWCERDGDGDPVGSVVDDPNATASLLAALGALRLDPRAAALAHVADAAASALLAAASRFADEKQWRLFASAAADALARVGPTHASRLSAVRWLPWNSLREQRVQDLASVVALKDIQQILMPLLARALAKQEVGVKYAPHQDLRKDATAAIADVLVDGNTSPEEAWCLVSAIRHVDVVLHAGMVDTGGSDETQEEQSAAQKSFMTFLKECKARVPRSNKTGLAALKNLAVATYTRHQRAQQLRDTRRD